MTFLDSLTTSPRSRPIRSFNLSGLVVLASVASVPLVAQQSTRLPAPPGAHLATLPPFALKINRTFVNYDWSDRATDPRRARHGDYIGVAARDGWVFGAWPESRPVANGTPLPDVPLGAAMIRVGRARFR